MNLNLDYQIEIMVMVLEKHPYIFSGQTEDQKIQSFFHYIQEGKNNYSSFCTYKTCIKLQNLIISNPAIALTSNNSLIRSLAEKLCR